jgi:hypothetical protein
MSCGTAPAASWTLSCGTENEVSMKRKRWEESLADDGSEDWERERQERQARLQMQLLMHDTQSFWSLMVSTEERIRAKQRTASTTIAAAVRRRLARYACVYSPSPFALAPPPFVSPRSVLPRKQYCFEVEPRNDLRHLQMP